MSRLKNVVIFLKITIYFLLSRPFGYICIHSVAVLPLTNVASKNHCYNKSLDYACQDASLSSISCIADCQEIIKVRERIPHIGPLTKVILQKLFLDIVPFSSADVTRAMRGQPKRLARN